MEGDAVVIHDGAVRPSFSLAWDGDGYGLTWFRPGNETGVFLRLSGEGQPLGPPVDFFDGALFPQIVFTGQEYVIVATSFGHLRFARFSLDGEPLGDPIAIRDAGAEATATAVTWNGAELGVAWRGDGGAWFARVTSDGRQVGDATMVTEVGDLQRRGLTWTGSNFVVLWEGAAAPGQRRPLYVRRLAPDGSPSGPGSVLDGEYSTVSSLRGQHAVAVSTEVGVAIAWADGRDGGFSGEIFVRPSPFECVP